MLFIFFCNEASYYCIGNLVEDLMNKKVGMIKKLQNAQKYQSHELIDRFSLIHYQSDRPIKWHINLIVNFKFV